MQQKQQRREQRQEILLKLLARAARRKRVRFGLRKQRGAAPGLSQLLVLQLFQPLPFLEAHLEKADDRDQKTDADERGAHRAGRGGGVAADQGAAGADPQENDPVYDSDFLNASFHVQLSSRSSNSTSPNASEAPR